MVDAVGGAIGDVCQMLTVVCLVQRMFAGAAMTMVCLVRQMLAGAAIGCHCLAMFGVIAGCIGSSGLVDFNVVLSCCWWGRCWLFRQWLLDFGDCGTNLLFVGECVRVGMLIGCVSWPSLVMLGVWLHSGSLGKRFCLDYLVITGALRRWSTVEELFKGTPSVASTRPVITSCDIVVVVCYRTLSGVMIVCS